MVAPVHRFFALIFPTFVLACNCSSSKNSQSNCTNELVNDQDVLLYFQQDVQPISSFVRPVKKQSTSVGVSVVFRLRQVVDVNEKNQEVSLNGYFMVRWYDELRRWDHLWPLSCVKYIVVKEVGQHDIWTPSLAISTS